MGSLSSLPVFNFFPGLMEGAMVIALGLALCLRLYVPILCTMLIVI